MNQTVYNDIAWEERWQGPENPRGFSVNNLLSNFSRFFYYLILSIIAIILHFNS